MINMLDMMRTQVVRLKKKKGFLKECLSIPISLFIFLLHFETLKKKSIIKSKNNKETCFWYSKRQVKYF